MTKPALPWHAPVRFEDVADAGLHLDLSPDAQVRAALAVLAGVREMPRLQAALDVVRQGSGLRVTGRVSAAVGQTCVVTLEPMESLIDEPIDVTFAPHPEEELSEESDVFDGDDPPEPLVDGVADVGAVAAEFLLLGIDPYPRKPEAAFVPPVEDNIGANPFAVLAKLKDVGN
jgi:uncharacterized metal-binding protein YceD (DUF177 family)